MKNQQLDYPDQPREEGVVVARLLSGLGKRPHAMHSIEA
jgi:hypothetical protein